MKRKRSSWEKVATSLGVPAQRESRPVVRSDAVHHPKHYTAHPSGIECIQIVEHMGFCLGNAIKYIWRADLKNGTEDLEKAVWYLQREIVKRRLEEHRTKIR